MRAAVPPLRDTPSRLTAAERSSKRETTNAAFWPPNPRLSLKA
jgi:hypothetical protein